MRINSSHESERRLLKRAGEPMEQPGGTECSPEEADARALAERILGDYRDALTKKEVAWLTLHADAAEAQQRLASIVWLESMAIGEQPGQFGREGRVAMLRAAISDRHVPTNPHDAVGQNAEIQKKIAELDSRVLLQSTIGTYEHALDPRKQEWLKTHRDHPLLPWVAARVRAAEAQALLSRGGIMSKGEREILFVTSIVIAMESDVLIAQAQQTKNEAALLEREEYEELYDAVTYQIDGVDPWVLRRATELHLEPRRNRSDAKISVIDGMTGKRMATMLVNTIEKFVTVAKDMQGLKGIEGALVTV